MLHLEQLENIKFTEKIFWYLITICQYTLEYTYYTSNNVNIFKGKLKNVLVWKESHAAFEDARSVIKYTEKLLKMSSETFLL